MHKVLSISLLCVAGTIALFTWYGSHGVVQLNTLSREEAVLQSNNRRLRSGIVGFKNKLYAVSKDSHSLEKKVRTELGMAKPGEVIYVIDQQNK